jgi:hypothetical protein
VVAHTCNPSYAEAEVGELWSEAFPEQKAQNPSGKETKSKKAFGSNATVKALGSKHSTKERNSLYVVQR